MSYFKLFINDKILKIINYKKNKNKINKKLKFTIFYFLTYRKFNKEFQHMSH